MFDLIILSGEYAVNSNMKGIGYRLWEIANALNFKYGLKIKIIAPEPFNPSSKRIKFTLATNRNIKKNLAQSKSFLVTYGCDPNFLRRAKSLNKTVIFDSLMTPIETFQYQKVKKMAKSKRNKFIDEQMESYKEALSLSDYIITGSYEEKEIMIGQLLMLGKINYENHNKFNKLIDIIPIGFSRSLFLKRWKTTSSKTFLWNGGVWNHYDIKNLLLAFKVLAKKGSKIKLHFLYKSGTDNFKQIIDFVQKKRLKKTIILPDEATDYFSRSNVVSSSRGIIVMFGDTLEANTTLRLRIRDVLLYQKPIITSKYGLLGRFVAQNKIGCSIDNSVNSIIEAVEKLSSDNAYYDSCIQEIKKLAKQYEYEKTCERLSKFIISQKND